MTRTAPALLALLLAVACSPAPGLNPSHPGAPLFASKGCTSCHGSQGEGKWLGPPLRGLSEHWTQSELAAYIAHPGPFLESKAHLAGVAAGFKSHMPDNPHLTEQERLDLGDYVLGFPPAD